jgi:adenylate kinase
LVEAESTFWPLSPGASPAKAKVLVLGPTPAALAARSRSLNLEHVSAAHLMGQEISRQTPAGAQARRAQEQGQPVPELVLLGVMRRWFWTRKPDAGFLLSDFPATLLQALVFDEWLEARGTRLSGVLMAPGADVPTALVDHYRTLGHDPYPADQLLAA